MLAVAGDPFIALTRGAVFERLVCFVREGRIQVEFFSLQDDNVYN